ncbi:GNAT family N-acetyltransferase [Actinomycetospora endophytica]|uniref:GNAT family N-acetyltransferase n=1 Tax=Actinomycetospora endophytica TaxID=2291215 RepID=A0ABS8P729_9PSEU|nr:GNAT family N-acetyltransferase [Actinomycetospora endophytica]MCD2194048.1 GNAT family N-acetyltransferase [Actinomycetospora endophytica]
MDVRAFADHDWPQVWALVAGAARDGDTYAYDPGMTEESGRRAWLRPPPGRVLVAADGEAVLGTVSMGPNRDGPGRHVANASFLVAPDVRGRGVGRALVRAALETARADGYAGMVFNAVVATNVHAVRLYEQEGFAIVGTVPEAFTHPTAGRVGLHVMYRAL